MSRRSFSSLTKDAHASSAIATPHARGSSVEETRDCTANQAENETLAAYNRAAETLCADYEAQAIPPLADVYERWIPAGSRVLELGCGSGRDARWLAQRGAHVVATDGASAMLSQAASVAENLQGNKSTTAGTLRFCELRLPATFGDRSSLFQQLGLASESPAFDVVLACALLQHLTDEALYRTALLIESATDERSVFIASVPIHHPGVRADAYGRHYIERTPEHYSALFERFGFEEVFREKSHSSGAQGRECHWVTLVFLKRTGRFAARTNITGLLESDRKTATYKFALLRALCDVNIASPGRVRYLECTTNGESHEHAAIPFSLIIERVIAYYWSIERMRMKGALFVAGAEAPRQIANNRSLGFINQLRSLMVQYGGDWHAFRRQFYAGDLARTLNLERAKAFTALADAVATTLKKGPVYYAGNSLGETAQAGEHNRLFAVTGTSSKASALTPASMAKRYGELLLPSNLWRELNVCAPFAVDTILLRWAELSKRLSDIAGLVFTSGEIVEAMLPAQDDRDVRIAHDVYLEHILAEDTHCVWTGVTLKKKFAVVLIDRCTI